MKRFFVVFLALAMVTFTTGAQQLTIGFVSPDQGASTQARVANKLEQVAKREGWKISISSATGSWEKMANIVEDYVSKKVSVIVIAMGQVNSLTPALQAAVKANIPVIAIDSEYTDLLTADILTNNWEMGAKISTYMVDRLNHKGNIIVFKFDQFYGTRYRGEILDTILSEEPDIKVLDTHFVPPTGFVEDAQSAMQAYLVKYGSKIDAVWCAYDDLAYGVSLAVKEKGFGPDDIFVVGIDGTDRNLRLIKSGTSPVVGTIIQPYDDAVEKAADLIKKLIIQKKSAKEVVGSVKVIYMSTPLITSANVDDYLK
ncbi:putative ABC-type sugar transport system periplasmic component-like protein [uncultured spirochete]|uniref:Putative ABC-type sugar transport system periplasmic component-like protein n=1 Tax=uncultured spirochete TaxID=156406 RepID=A0A3P3XPL9_9SPIR|nr:putative ABC-type sugar transport system periplasmic component-like protein [uncultured spirochete]